ncbi:Signal recognition particle receptor, beta subunit [Ophiocordyceps camponoti-floridani]|uniref:Signal recognition particle receptor subunit beta n=1 Tax=Ophiocordyceps camponoti-floridani TaxID=2030778 RepID=A0A8H4Q0K7_9HYPO|nr:Signal recognition particle receptor, beta subunit [Ophiocordyceps camponoti-floridani]
MASTTHIIESLLSPSLPVLFLGLLIVIGAPILLHFIVITSSSAYTSPPAILVLGPQGAGKTALATALERGSLSSSAGPSQTRTSQVTHVVELNASTDSSSRRSFRNHDDASGTHTKFRLVDTPGHAKLRSAAMTSLAAERRLRAVVFLVDAAALAEQDALVPTAAYLYDLLLFLQRRASAAKSGARPIVPVLIAANKTDLFTAIPAAAVRTRLESELTRTRASRSKGLLDSGVGIDDVGESEDVWLGEYGSADFSMEQMREFDIDVDVIGGSVTGHGEGGPDIDGWWWWMAQRVS